MPNRIVREGIITSESVNSLSWAEEVFYRRLLSVVDDYGRYYGNPSLLRAACYPLQLDKVGNQDIAKWLTKCVGAGLVKVYTVDGKEYIEVLKFGQQVRAKSSKYPACIADATQMHSRRTADAHLDVVGDGDDITVRFDRFWKAYPRKVKKPSAFKAWKRLSPDDALTDQIVAVVERTQWPADQTYIPHPSSWLNDRRWEDEVTPERKIRVAI